MLKTIAYLWYLELVMRLRRSQEWAYPLGFFLVITILFPLGMTANPTLVNKLMPGFLWIAALLASLLAAENLFATDFNEGHAEQLILSQLPLSQLVLIKLAAHWLVTEMPLVLLAPLLGCLFQLPIQTNLMLALSLLIGTPILTFLGGLGAVLTTGLRQQGMLLGLLILPLALPILIFGVNISLQTSQSLSVLGPVMFLLSLLTLSVLFLPYAIAFALRVGVDD